MLMSATVQNLQQCKYAGVYFTPTPMPAYVIQIPLPAWGLIAEYCFVVWQSTGDKWNTLSTEPSTAFDDEQKNTVTSHDDDLYRSSTSSDNDWVATTLPPVVVRWRKRSISINA